jgi:hypothetical protein
MVAVALGAGNLVGKPQDLVAAALQTLTEPLILGVALVVFMEAGN